jgi:hypothetical protein
MSLVSLPHLLLVCCRAVLMAAVCAAAPCASTEAQVEVESTAIVAHESASGLSEQDLQCHHGTVDLAQLAAERASSARQERGHSGRRITNTLLAPLRC